MAAVKSRDTGPELVVRRAIHGMGYRYRLHDKALPGHPDLVFPRWKKIIFVHGCFWHRHNCRLGKSLPATRREFWESKFDSNKKRDRRVQRQLKSAGWQVLVVWQCETTSAQLPALLTKLSRFMHPTERETKRWQNINSERMIRSPSA